MRNMIASAAFVPLGKGIVSKDMAVAMRMRWANVQLDQRVGR